MKSFRDSNNAMTPPGGEKSILYGIFDSVIA